MLEIKLQSILPAHWVQAQIGVGPSAFQYPAVSRMGGVRKMRGKKDERAEAVSKL